MGKDNSDDRPTSADEDGAAGTIEDLFSKSFAQMREEIAQDWGLPPGISIYDGPTIPEADVGVEFPDIVVAFGENEGNPHVIVKKVCEALARSGHAAAAEKFRSDAAEIFRSGAAAKRTFAELLRLVARTVGFPLSNRPRGAHLAFSPILGTPGGSSALDTYISTQRQRQAAFKQSWNRMPPAAREDGEYSGQSYPFVLPSGLARSNLWDPIRTAALRHFYVQRIAWHDGQNRGPLEQREPSPHLLDSQVCVVNFWWGLSLSPDSLATALRSVFADVDHVVLSSESGPLAEVEWVGLESYLGERGWPSRGEYATSADLLLAYEDASGGRHGVLVESKYTESYPPGKWLDRGNKGRARIATYSPLFYGPGSPIQPGLDLDLKDLLIEPFYQHLRQQLLASGMEQAGELGFETVTCLHVSPRANQAFHAGMTAPKMKKFGDTVGEAWPKILSQPDRYRSVAYEDLFAAVTAEGDPQMVGWEQYQRVRYGWDSTTLARSTPFRRGLSEEFFGWLRTGPGQALVDVFKRHDLDVRLRGNYLNAYDAQCSLARVQWNGRSHTASLAIHKAYIQDSLLARQENLNSERNSYARFAATAELVGRYADAFPEIRTLVSERYVKPEGKWEEECSRANLEGTPLLVMDRQIVSGRPPARLDVLAVGGAESTPFMVAVELKRDLDNRIQHVPGQTAKYLRMLDPEGAGLRDDVARSYVDVCRQLRALGFKAPDPGLVRTGMRVAGLVALANYKEKSELLARAFAEARKLDREIRFCKLGKHDLVLPDEVEWISA